MCPAFLKNQKLLLASAVGASKQSFLCDILQKPENCDIILKRIKKELRFFDEASIESLFVL
jgi:hypothetical protein